VRKLSYYKKKEKKYKPVILEYIKNCQVNEDIMVNGLDWLIHCCRFKNGETFIDQFVKGHHDLTESELMILEKWKYSFEGIFKIDSIEDNVVRLVNLMDDIEYTAASDLGGKALEDLRADCYIASRLIPLDDIYLLSGKQYIFPMEAKDSLTKIVFETLKPAYAQALANSKVKYAEAWKMPHSYRNNFIDCFGSDFIVVPGVELTEIMGRFIDFHNNKIMKDITDGEIKQDQSRIPELNFPPALTGSKKVGIIFDEIEGLNFYPDFQLFMPPFSIDPGLMEGEDYRQALMGYLESYTISPLPFMKMVAKYPDNASEVFARLFDKQDWDNERDLDILVMNYKKKFLLKEPVPMFVAVN